MTSSTRSEKKMLKTFIQPFYNEKTQTKNKAKKDTKLKDIKNLKLKKLGSKRKLSDHS